MTDGGTGASVPVIRFLDEERCLALLGECRVGRVAVLVSGVPHVVPVNYALLDGDIVFRSGSGTKLHAAIQSQPVSFEVDRIDDDTRSGWSVLVSGIATVVTDGEARARIDALDLEPWAPGARDELVRVRADLVSGREISRP
jgi:nitroimidazol reductase NimA-like FMN-containing flavoprotein (pyridoxamine 5'-phosphate oxidase superfamily)